MKEKMRSAKDMFELKLALQQKLNQQSVTIG
jgi:hypothetical protein